MARSELKMQAHICASYVLQGGYACKWDPANAKGKPDLVCSLPGIGGHFMEVKHRPEVRMQQRGVIKNPLEARQVHEAKLIISAGGVVLGGLVIQGGRSVSDACLGLFNPLAELWYPNEATWAEWQGTKKFDVARLLHNWRTKNGG